MKKKRKKKEFNIDKLISVLDHIYKEFKYIEAYFQFETNWNTTYIRYKNDDDKQYI